MLDSSSDDRLWDQKKTFCTGLSYIEIYVYTLTASLSRAAGFEEIPRMAD